MKLAQVYGGALPFQRFNEGNYVSGKVSAIPERDLSGAEVSRAPKPSGSTRSGHGDGEAEFAIFLLVLDGLLPLRAVDETFRQHFLRSRCGYTENTRIHRSLSKPSCSMSNSPKVSHHC